MNLFFRRLLLFPFFIQIVSCVTTPHHTPNNSINTASNTQQNIPLLSPQEIEISKQLSAALNDAKRESIYELLRLSDELQTNMNNMLCVGNHGSYSNALREPFSTGFSMGFEFSNLMTLTGYRLAFEYSKISKENSTYQSLLDEIKAYIINYSERQKSLRNNAIEALLGNSKNDCQTQYGKYSMLAYDMGTNAGFKKSFFNKDACIQAFIKMYQILNEDAEKSAELLKETAKTKCEFYLKEQERLTLESGK